MFKKFLMVMVMFVLFLGLVACGNTSEEDELLANDLVGTWVWDTMEEFEYLFEADGTGSRGSDFLSESFEWEVTRGELRINVNNMTERWEAVIESDILTISSLQVDGMIYSYIRR